MPITRTFIAIAALALAATMAQAKDYRLEKRDPVHHVFSPVAANLDVDQVNGSITITGDGGKQIRVEGERIIRAETPEEIDRAAREVTLDLNEKDGTGQVYVNGPFRNSDHASENHGFHEHSDRHYEVTYNFIVHVPRAAALRLRTVNGSIQGQDTEGAFDIHTINGQITLNNIGGSGTVDTLNGNTTITFRENPKNASYFKSFNGRVDVTFQPSLSADLRFKSFNGHAYTDFDSVALAGLPVQPQHRDGKTVYRTNEFSGVRVGAGGPELKFETFNGDIRIHKQAR